MISKKTDYQHKKPKNILVKKFLKEYDQFCKDNTKDFDYEQYLKDHIGLYIITMQEAALKGMVYHTEHIHKLDTCTRLYSELKRNKNEK